MTRSVLDVGNLEGTWMLLEGGKGSDSTNVVSTGKGNGGTLDELDNSADFTVGEIYL